MVDDAARQQRRGRAPVEPHEGHRRLEGVAHASGYGVLQRFVAATVLQGLEALPRASASVPIDMSISPSRQTYAVCVQCKYTPYVYTVSRGMSRSLVGESEQKMRSALKVIDAFGECVCWLDEVEKAFSGTKSSGEVDAGTTSNMFAAFLTWMQETKSSVLVMATANDVSKLPPEFIRAGRFDAVFWVDCPTISERIEIIKIMNRKYNSKIPTTFANQKLSGWTGAEIEQLAKDSLYDGVEAAYDAIVPLSRTMREEIKSLKDWAKSRARLANTPEDQPTKHRKLKSFKHAS